MRVVALSLAVHAALFALVLRTPRRERVNEPAPLTPIEVVEDEPPPVVPIERAPPSGPGSIAESRRAASAAHRVDGIAPVARGDDGPPPATGESPPHPAPVWTGSFLSLGPKEIGIGGENPFLPSSPPSPAASTKPDLGLRFGPSSEGPALAVFRDVTSRSLAPLEGRARFTLRANADGEVLGIDIDESTGGPGWDDARRLALEGLRGKKIAVPRGARGVNMRFEIVSEVSYPSGQKKKGEFSIRGVAVVLPDESSIGQSPTRKIHTRHLLTEVL